MLSYENDTRKHLIKSMFFMSVLNVHYAHPVSVGIIFVKMLECPVENKDGKLIDMFKNTIPACLYLIIYLQLISRSHPNISDLLEIQPSRNSHAISNYRLDPWRKAHSSTGRNAANPHPITVY